MRFLSSDSSSRSTSFATVGSQLYFESDSATARQICRTDGSVVTRVSSFGSQALPEILAASGHTLFFVATDAAHGRELWRTNSTGGVVLAADLVEGPVGSFPYEVVPLGSSVFVAGSHDQGDLWRIDGVLSAQPVSTNFEVYSPSGLSVVGSTLFFFTDDETNGSELWRTTSQGIVSVANLTDVENGSYPSSPVSGGDAVFFVAKGDEIWKATATGGAAKIATFPPETSATGSASYGAIALLGDSLLFAADDGTHGNELWAADAVSGSTAMVKDVAQGNGDAFHGSGSYGSAVLFNGALYFAASSGIEEGSLRRSDGTEGGTTLVAPVDPAELTVAGDLIFFTTWTYQHGRELWKSDGTQQGTVLVSDLDPGTSPGGPGQGSYPWRLTALGGTLFFMADDGTGDALWKTDGETTEKIEGFALSPAEMVAFDGELFFTASDDAHGLELRRLDVSSGIVETYDFIPGSDSSYPFNLTVAGDTLFFGGTGGDGQGLWKFVPPAGGPGTASRLRVWKRVVWDRGGEQARVFRLDRRWNPNVGEQGHGRQHHAPRL